MNISMKLVYQYVIAIFFTFSPTLNHFHPLQVENCGSNSRLVVDEDDNVTSGLKGLNTKCTYTKALSLYFISLHSNNVKLFIVNTSGTFRSG